MSNHVVIAGTGRAGTTFLVKLLTNLGLDTGFDKNELKVHENARAGLEIDLLKTDSSPYIVKDPSFYEYAEDVLCAEHIHIDCVIIPVRDLDAAIESRAHVERSTDKGQYLEEHVPGGFLGEGACRDRQEVILLKGFYGLLCTLSKAEVPVILLNYPNLVSNADYLYEKLRPLVGHIEASSFQDVYEETLDKGLVHSFGEKDSEQVFSNHPELEVHEDYAWKREFQIFLDYGAGFTEGDSYHYPLKTDEETIELDLGGQQINELRLDPSHEACIWSLEELTLYGPGQKRVPYTLKDSNALLEENGVYYFTKDDPQLLVEVGGAVITKLHLRAKYNADGKKSLVETSSALKKSLDHCRQSALRKIYNYVFKRV